MRPLVMDFTADTQVNDIGDQYMFGPSFMVSPVYRYGDRAVKSISQAEGWYDFIPASLSGGEKKMIDAPYERDSVVCACRSYRTVR